MTALETEPIDRIAAPSADVFLRDYVRRSKPVIITGAIEDWPARKLWTVDYLKSKCGDEVVPVAQAYGGNVKHDPKTGIPNAPMTFGEYLDRIQSPTPADMYLMCLLHEYLHSLAADVRAPAFAPKAPWAIRKIWISPANTRTPLHMDLPENIFAQVIGRKRVTLLRPSWGRRMYRFPLWSKLPQLSRADVEEPDFARFPLLREAHPLRGVVEPGDLLYIPRFWWHQVRSLDLSVSVNYWWATGPLYAVIKTALTYQKLRTIKFGS